MPLRKIDPPAFPPLKPKPLLTFKQKVQEKLKEHRRRKQDRFDGKIKIRGEFNYSPIDKWIPKQKPVKKKNNSVYELKRFCSINRGCKPQARKFTAINPLVGNSFWTLVYYSHFYITVTRSDNDITGEHTVQVWVRDNRDEPATLIGTQVVTCHLKKDIEIIIKTISLYIFQKKFYPALIQL